LQFNITLPQTRHAKKLRCFTFLFSQLLKPKFGSNWRLLSGME